MAGKQYLLLFLQMVWVAADGSWSQRSPYSLQAAVDELHRREASKYPLNVPPSSQHYFGGGANNEQDYWDDDTDFPATNNNKNRNRHRLNKALGKYLERENYDSGLGLGPFGGYEFDEDSNNLFPSYADEKKRSSYFRERDNKYDNLPSSVFRERESQASSGNGGADAELTDQFLREIEETQEHEREERYKEALRHLWEKYQQQENEIEGDLFEEKKRMRMPPYYMLMQKKRSSYPVLPWLPYSERKKRFPVSKRSTKRSSNDNLNLGKTDEKVARELSELFGTPSDHEDEEKKKRSTDEQTQVSSTHTPDATSTALSDMHLNGAIVQDKSNASKTTTGTAPVVDEHQQHGQHGRAGYHAGHMQKEHKHRKRSEHHSHESHEYDEDSEEHEEHEDHDEHEDEEGEEEDHEEEEEEERKKKRDVAGMKHSSMNGEELFKAGPALPATNFRRKKSIQWSKYFGLDRKKKSMKKDNNRLSLDVKKRSTNNDDDEEEAVEKEHTKMRDLAYEKLDNMDKKLQSLEDFIIDETIKYTGAHEGIANPEEIRHLKDRVLSRLATAYSLEKMRRALEKLRQSVDSENHLLHNVIEPDSTHTNEIDSWENQKRLSVKKEKAPVHQHVEPSSPIEKSKEMHSNSVMRSASDSHNIHAEGNDDDVSDDDDHMKKKKKKSNGYVRYPELPNDFNDFEEELGAGHYEALNDAYLGNKNYMMGSNQCPLIESMSDRCRGVDLLSGDINQELLPICGVHQICYLCGTSQVACDYQYLAEADSICGTNNDCQAAARSVLMILRGSPGPQLGPRECLKNPCLYSAMREIGL